MIWSQDNKCIAAKKKIYDPIVIYVGNCYSSDHLIQKFQLHKQTHNFYRVVSKEEYVRKVQEKYESTILNIVLKHLINEDFVW